MHNNSLPPTDREEAQAQPVPASKPAKAPAKVFPCNTALRDSLKALRDAEGSIYSNGTIAAKLKYSPAVISQYLSEDGCKYTGSIATLENKIEDFLKALSNRRATGIETRPSQIADEIETAFNYIRNNQQLGLVIAESGEGKSRACELIQKNNPLVIFINVTEWNSSKHGIMSAIWQACPHDGWDRCSPQFLWLVTRLRGSELPFIFDNAHKLGREGLSLVSTFADETKCPVVLLGLPVLVDKFVSDITSQSTSRVGVHWPVKINPKADKKLLKGMIMDVCKTVDGELDDIIDLCQQVADHHGHFRACEQRLKAAASLHRAEVPFTKEMAKDQIEGEEGQPLNWVGCFRLAHRRSLHPCQLT